VCGEDQTRAIASIGRESIEGLLDMIRVGRDEPGVLVPVADIRDVDGGRAGGGQRKTRVAYVLAVLQAA
jgi:hypothetical protein